MPASLLLLMALTLSPLDTSLDRVPTRRAEWRRLREKTPKPEKEAVEYLLTWMSLSDLETLPTKTVAEAAHLAVTARKQTSWGPKVPEAIFLDAVVPYASVTEPRQSMRAEWAAKYGPLVKGTKSPGEAAMLVNSQPVQGHEGDLQHEAAADRPEPAESIAQGMATCTGLSIMLVDALRAVGVPSRLAGIRVLAGARRQPHLGRGLERRRLALRGRGRAGREGAGPRLVRGRGGTGAGTKPDETIYAVTYKPSERSFPSCGNRGATIRRRERHAALPVWHSRRSEPRLMVEVKERG